LIAYDGSMTRTPPELYAWLLDNLAKTGNAGHDAPRLEALQTEASFRQFYRVLGGKVALVLMDSPPAKEANAQFVAVAEAFAANNLRVPRILAHNIEAGWLLLTDLGKTHFIDAYKDGRERQCLFAALNTLQHIAAVNDPVIPDYKAERLSDELDIFAHWLVRDACNIALPERQFEAVRKLLLANAADQPQVCVHRDFHCKNLLWQEPLQGQNSSEDPVGLLDFQDALRGPAGYDLASLLHDCYWKFSDEVIDAVISESPGSSRRAIDLLAVQRQLKAVGIFTRLALRDSKLSHLQHIQPVLNNLIDLCSRYQELKPMGNWLANSVVEPARKWILTAQH